ncbi:MAG TPA: M56 family metallopeptidase, partial [Xanthomonadales bacterium]|nr:M56 family metallopeptidase [Xanthomonadales bacterium]
MDALLLAVFNALWQGAALIALVALGLRAGLRRNATTACVVWSITFLVVALLPAIDLALARPAVAPLAPSVASARPRNTAAVPRLATVVPATAPQRATDVIGPMRAAVGERVRDGSMRVGSAATAFARMWGIALFCAWALVAGALLLRLARGYAAVARMKRAATPLDDPLVLARLRGAGHRRRATVARSLLVDVPCAVGFRNPMILIPARLAESLDGDDLARVVLHESAHLQRYDDWLNALEQVVCALQFFQPALHVARRGIDFEREVACDDRVLEDAGEPLRYAECLARIVSRNVRGPRVAVAPGFVVRRAQVVGRVRRIVDRSRDASPQLRFAAVALTAVVLAATLGIARLQVPVVATASAATPVVVTPRFAEPAKPLPATAVSRPARAYAVRANKAHSAHIVAQRAAVVTKTTSATRTTAATRATIAAVTAHVGAVRTAPRADVPAPARTPCGSPDDSSPPAPPAPAARPVAFGEARRAPEAIRAAVTTVTTFTAPAAAVTVTTPAATESVSRIAPRAVEAPSAPAAARFGGDLLEAIDDAKYPHPSVDELIALRNQGVSGDYVRRMGGLRPRPALHDLLALAAQGVTPDYVAALNRRLAVEPSLSQIVALRAQGVSGAWLEGLGAIGYPKLSVDDA